MPNKNDKINIFFVIKAGYLNEGNSSNDMKLAFSNAVDWNLKPKWIKEEECDIIDSNAKGNVFVFEEFAGDFFQNFISTYRHTRVIGAKCLLVCFMEQIPIPNTKFPVFNMAMNGLLISASVKPAEAKKTVMELVGYMGGTLVNKLLTSTTHLVVSSVFSEMYYKANEEGIPVLKLQWVEEIWQRSLVSDVKAADENFIKEYKCPLFYNLIVTASQLGETEKRKIKKIISDGGGTYSSELEFGVTNLLIIPAGRGDKYKFAVRWKVKCVNPSWLDQCIAKGYAARFDDYLVPPEKKCSTPVHSYNPKNMGNLVDSNDTDISAIPSNLGTTVVAETACYDTQTQKELALRNGANIFKTPVKNADCPTSEKPCSSRDPLLYQKILEGIKLNDVKKCQHLFDGCKVYIAGFNTNEEEKLRRILKYGGAIRFTDLNESVTHVIVGNPTSFEIESLKSVMNKPHIVKLDWLSSSITKGCLENESNCAFFCENKEPCKQNLINSIQQPSPLSKKGMQILNPVRQIPINTHPIVGVDQILIEKYSSSHECENNFQPSREDTKNSICEEQPANESNSSNKLFDGLRFTVIGHTISVTEAIKATISDYGGINVSNTHSVVDYTIVPFTNIISRVTSSEVVTLLWIEECLSVEAVVPTKYYHRPVSTPDVNHGRPLNDCVITFTSYNVHEKQYLENVAIFLGAKCQDVLSKKQNNEKKVAQTTHLVCSHVGGVKFTAAKKWNLPVVRETWLLQCFHTGTKLPVEEFCVTEDNITSSATSSMIPAKITNKPENTLLVQPKQNKVTTTTSATPVINIPSDIANHQSNAVLHPPPLMNTNQNEVSKSHNMLSFKLNTKSVPVERVRVTTPSIAEAVHRSTIRNVNRNDQSHKSEATTKKNWPTGLLLEINECASSSLKRKLDCQGKNFHETPRPGSPRKKLLRLDHPSSSSPYEEVGWQDTLTDLSNIQSENADSAEKSIIKTKPDVNFDASASGKNVPPNKNRSGTRLVVDDTKKISTTTVAPRCESSAEKRDSNVSRNFLISMPTTEKKARCEEVITSLGGRIISVFPTDCPELEKASHIIIDELKKTEKLLCSIASGIWILHSSYLDRCVEAQTFLPEDQFEWGNPLNDRLLAKASKDCTLIARAAYRWRQTITSKGSSARPFVGMKAVIISAPKDEAVHSLTRVVKSGGGFVFPSCDILNATHCLLKATKLELVPVPLKQLAERKIHLLPAVYLSDYLMNDPPPDVRTCYFEQYKRLL